MSVVDIAKAELGYKEIGNNDTKYGKWYGLNNNPWCAMFVSWCFNQAGLGKNIVAQNSKGFASCQAGLKWFTNRGKIVPVGKAQAGDIVLFQFDADVEADHVGICASNDGKKYLMVYEGNTSGDSKGSQSNGDGVFLKKRSYSLVMGVARP